MYQQTGETLYLSAKVDKINGWGMKQSRVLLITDQSILNFHPDKDKESKKIPMDRIDALTLSKKPVNESAEFVIHMKGGYDHHYEAGKLRDTICETIRRLR